MILKFIKTVQESFYLQTGKIELKLKYKLIRIGYFDGVKKKYERDELLLWQHQKQFPSTAVSYTHLKDPMIAALPPQHPLAKQSAIRPEQLTGEPLIMPGNGRSPDSMEVLQKFSVKPNIKYSTIEHNSAFSLVEQGLGICITNELITQGRIKSAVLRPFDPPTKD